MAAFWAVRLGSLMAGGGIAWAVYVFTDHADLSEMFVVAGFSKVFMQSGPMEVCALGVVLWLWGKWKHSVDMRR